MRAARGLLVVAGAGFGLWGLWLMRDFTSEQLVSAGTWFAAGIVLHDFILAPVVVVLGFAAARSLPGHVRSAAGVAFLVWATLTVAFIPVLSGQGGKPDNDTILHRPYVLSWVVMTLLIAALAAVAALRRRLSSSKPAG